MGFIPPHEGRVQAAATLRDVGCTVTKIRHILVLFRFMFSKQRAIF